MPTLRLLPEFEDELKRLPGIIAASVVTGPDAVPTEVHVLAEPGKAAKQVVRDVQSFALLKLGLDIDHRIVSVVQIGADEVGMPLQPTTTATRSRPRAEPPRGRRSARSWCAPPAPSPRPLVTVAATGGHVFEGRVIGPGRPRRSGPGWSRRPRCDALDELLGTHRRGRERRGRRRLGAREVAVTVLTVMVPRLGEQLVTGSALVRGDESDAVARAVLDALNRRLAG